MKITAQDFHALYAPSECGLRVFLRANREPEAEPSEFERVLMRLGQRNEAAHLATFPQCANLAILPFESRAERTLTLVAEQTGVLYQPVLQCRARIDGVDCECVGEPDFLILESGGYVIRDVKLVRHVDMDEHPEVILQLQFYGWLYSQVFGTPPLRLEVFNGKGEIITVPNTFNDVLPHVRRILTLKTMTEVPYWPVGWSRCGACGFHDRCWCEARRTNDVALVYGVDQGLALELHNRDVVLIEQLVQQFNEAELAELLRPWGDGMKKVGGSAGAILRAAQALLTNTETVLARPRIPEHKHYVMFDLEGMPPQLDELGKVYLWGMQVFGDTPGGYQPAVADFGKDGDENGWRDFLRKADQIFRQHGDIPFVHWASYERAQINEYIYRYGDPTGTAARVLANLLDLLPITRKSVVLPLCSYSLKEVEKYVGFNRTQDEYGGSWSMAKYIEATETEDRALRNQTMDKILLYNKEDLAATWAVFQWLRSRRCHSSATN